MLLCSDRITELGGMQNDPIIEAAKKDLAKLDAQRAELRSFIARYEEYRHALAGPDTLPPYPVHAVLVEKPARGTRSDQVMSAVHDILMERGDALTLSAIFNALVERGIVIGGVNPKQNLCQKLSAHPKLKSYGKRGWYFADTIPPCLQPKARLPEPWEYEEGLDTEVTRPLQPNGVGIINA
jgi:hypothetical protein